jgi:heterodisulfide reductase subunit A
MQVEKKVGSVMVVGGGVAGLQAALDLADSGYSVYLIEKSGAIGGAMAQLDKTFPTNDCSMCIIAPKLVECGRHANITLMTLSEVTGIIGTAGNFTVTVKESPRYVDMDKCVACGICAERCPKNAQNEYNADAGKRRAIYVKYAQAVPQKYQIDPASCLRLQKPGTCGFCETVCAAGAINFNDSEKIHQIDVGAVVLAPGFEAYDPKEARVWGYGTLPNVITSLQMERYLSATGPTEGQLMRPFDGKPVNKVAFLQCIGSRDEILCHNTYCSSVCCMYAVKNAIIAKEQTPGLSATIFYMDMRAHGKDFDKYLERAKNQAGVRFVRCRMNAVEPQGANGDLRIRYINETGRQVEEYYDMVVLSVGMQTPQHALELAETTGIKLTADRFAATSDFAPVQTSQAGIFACGAFAGPKDIPQSVVEGSAVAAAVANLLATVRYQLTAEILPPTEKDVGDEEPRIGVFVCHCGTNIAGVVDVKAVEEHAATLPGVVYVERNLFSCAQDSQDQIVKRIEEHQLNRIVIAACSPRTHEPLFRETLRSAGLNEYLVELANIRNHSSWVHADEPDMATSKAKDLVRMAVAKATHGVPLHPVSVPITRKGLVIGGGVTGMTAALNLAEQGFEVHLVEQTETLGGNAIFLKHTWSGEHIPNRIGKLIDKVIWNDRITIHKGCQITATDGYVGNFRSTVTAKNGATTVIEHGIGIIATGARMHPPTEYGYGSIRKVVTSIEFDKLHELKEKTVKASKNFVFIQCVGSRESGHMYCSKVCCTHSVQSAIELKQEDPARNVYILYRDMRTYGQRESLYRQARKMGVIFINYELHGKPLVTENGNQIKVEVWDHVLHRPLRIKADMVILASAIRPRDDARDLARLFKVPVDEDGFFLEAHSKLRPIDLATDGLFIAGLAHYPKPIEESVAQALAASARAATLLSKPKVSLDGVKATVDPVFCDGCALCIDVCPYKAITLHALETTDETGEAHKIVRINTAQCKGCGVCQGTCPKRGVYVAGFTMKQMSSQIQAALAV